MGKIGSAAELETVGGDGSYTAYDLKKKPVADKKPRRDIDDKKNNQSFDGRSSKKDQISAHYSGDGSGGAQGRNATADGKKILSDGSDKAGHQIKKQKGHVSVTVFDIVAEDMKKPHIGQNMKNAAMEKHRGKDCPIRAQD